jgi:hypothetical protein
MPARIAREFLTDIFWHWRNATERERERERESVSLCASIPGETSGAFTEVVVTPTFASTTLQETANPLPSSRLLFPICKQKNQIIVSQMVV